MRYLFLLLLFFLCIPAYPQENNLDENFINDFKKALDKNFSEGDLNGMFRKYQSILTPHNDVTRLTQQLQGNPISIFPLIDFKTQKLYSNNIDDLLNSSNQNQRILAYLVIASSQDTSKEKILLGKIKTETNKGNLIWAGMALLYLNCNHTTELFDFLVKNEDFGDAHMLPMFIKLNKDSLANTAYNRINSNDIKGKVLAAQILSVVPLNAKTEQILKTAVKNWDIRIKGYAIYSISALQIGNLLETFKPFIDSPQVHAIALKALGNSPSEKDREYLLDLVSKQDTLPSDLLDCFYKSKSNLNVQYWLKLLYTKKITKQYVFFVFDQPLISSDSNLIELQTALSNIKNPEVIGELVRALKGRTDDKSVDIMIGFLKYKNSTVRYWTAKTLSNNLSPKINATVKDLIKKGIEDGN